MNIAIITYYLNELNYGQRLQAFALQKFLKDIFKCNCHILDYNDIQSNSPFSEFEKNYMEIMPKQKIDLSKYDFLVLGSDQVLNFNFKQINDIFKAFNFSHIFKNQFITYSASDGGFFKNNISKSIKFFKFLKYFKQISMRECDSANFISNIFPNATVNVDPVFLLNRQYWKSIGVKYNNCIFNDFTFRYIINANKLRQDTSSISDNAMTLYGHTENNLNVSIENFIWLIDNCQTFITNSFHGVCFGILLGKNIICKNINDYRISNMLKLLHIKTKGNVILANSLDENVLKKNIQNTIEYFNHNFKIDKDIFFRERVAAYANDIKIRNISTSGGFCNILARYAFDNNGYVFGSAYSHDFSKVQMIRVDNIEEYESKLSGSKYSFSYLCELKKIKDTIQTGKMTLIIGVPCQIRAIDKYLNGKKPNNLIYAELLCSGACNNASLKKFIDAINEKHDSTVVKLDMRYQHQLQTKCHFKDGSSVLCDFNSYDFFIKNNMTALCKKCKLHHGSSLADFTIGDYWDFNKNDDFEEFDVKKGTNIIYINTYNGYKIFNNIKGQIKYLVSNL